MFKKTENQGFRTLAGSVGAAVGPSPETVSLPKKRDCPLQNHYFVQNAESV